MGTVRDNATAQLVNRYAARVPHYWPFELVELADVKLGKELPTPLVKKMQKPSDSFPRSATVTSLYFSTSMAGK